MPAEPDSHDNRPSPDALLATARQEQRGRLKVFLGAAPGVGKTYAMLRAAHRRKADGVDVVAGLIETHSRGETDALVIGLETLPRRAIAYKGHMLAEFDLDGALARRPGLILVDELAHTNGPDSRHPKRWQDVDELLAAGFDVYTTLNIQHVESLNDVVARITRIRVRETIPDSVLERADEVELVDLTPEELIKRLAEGKVYVPDQAKRAAANYFKPGNITALRELALRRTAERVDDQMVDYMRAHAIEGPWPAGERILVCVSAAPEAPALVRAARRMADLMNAHWTAVYVEMPGHYRLPETTRDRTAEALRLAEHLGGDSVTLPGRDLPNELLRYARNHNITQIVIGKSKASWLRTFFGRSLIHELVRRSDKIAIHVVPSESDDRSLLGRVRFRLFDAWRPWPYAASALAVVAAALIAEALGRSVPLPNLSMVFLIAVLFSAITYGVLPSLFTSILSSAIFNFFFIPPLYTFSIAGADEVLAYMTFVVVAVLAGSLAGRVRDQAFDARQRARTTAALYEFSSKLAATKTLDDLLWAVAFQVASAFRCKTVILLPDSDRLALRMGYPPDDELDEAERTAARWAWQKGEVAGRGSDTLPTIAWTFLPLKTARGTIGTIGLQFPDGAITLDPDQRRLLDALLDQAAVAVERTLLDRQMAESRMTAETERLRTALLSSISHDLKTPLASIIGSTSSLQAYGDSFSAAARNDLLVTIREEAERLNRFVANLLDITRLESGAIELRRDWVEAGDVIGSAVGRIRAQLGNRKIELDIPPGLPLIRVDFALFEQTLFNLLDNAAKYAPDGSTIRISTRVEGAKLIIEVVDGGPGIPESDLERIFDKFYRVKAGDRRAAGTGLGLSICRGFVEAHGGAVSARSPVAAGRGTAFAIRMPIDPQPSGVIAERHMPS